MQIVLISYHAMLKLMKWVLLGSSKEKPQQEVYQHH